MFVNAAAQVVDGLYLGNIRGKRNMMLLDFVTYSIARSGQTLVPEAKGHHYRPLMHE